MSLTHEQYVENGKKAAQTRRENKAAKAAKAADKAQVKSAASTQADASSGKENHVSKTNSEKSEKTVVNNNRPWNWVLGIIATVLAIILLVILLRGCYGIIPGSTNIPPTATAASVAKTVYPTFTSVATATSASVAPTLAPVASTASTSTVSSDNNVVVNGVVMGVVDPQMAQVHAAALYLPTGISGHNVWTIKIPVNGVLIVGGVTVNGVSGGVYQAWSGGQTVTIDVTNGFALVTLDRWANWEFCFRVEQAVQYEWAHGTVEGLPAWTACSSTVSVAETATVIPTATAAPEPVATVIPTVASTAPAERKETGKGQTLDFNQGDTVTGFRIVLKDGTTYDSCLITNSPTTGKVTDGVIWPDANEQSQAKPCN